MAANIFAQRRPLAPQQAGALFIDRPGLHSNAKRPAKASLSGNNRYVMQKLLAAELHHGLDHGLLPIDKMSRSKEMKE